MGRRNRRSQRRRTIAALAAGALALTAGACSPQVAIHGNTPEPDIVAGIAPGAHSRLDVQQRLGSPSSVSLYGQEVWYYIGNRTETLAFFEPDVVERQVVAIRFNGGGIVDGVEVFGKERGRDIEMVERTTPTRGNEISILDQIIGNIGRFEDSAK